MADFESLGGETRNNRQIAFLAISILATFLVASIFFEEYALLDSASKSLFLSSLILPIISVLAFIGVVGYMIVRDDFKNPLVLTILFILLASSVYLIREAITFFSASGFSGALAVGTVYLLIGSAGSAFLVLNIVKPKAVDGLDAVISEERDEGIFGLSFRSKMLIGVGLVAFTFFYITSTGLAFVQAPNFGLVEFGILDSQFGNAFVSGIVGGVIETVIFFAVLMPVIHGLAFRFSNNAVLASLIGIILITVIFWQFHTTVYAYSETAQLSVLIFGFTNAGLLLLFRDAYILTLFHFFNNFFVIFFAVTTFSIIAA